MKKILFLLLCLTLITALNVAWSADKIQPQISQGDKALLFTVNGLGDFGVQGAPAGMLVYATEGGVEFSNYNGIGFKTFISDKMALRIGLGYAGSTITRETDDGDIESSLSLLCLQPAIEYHMFQADAVSIYTGAGVFYAKSGATEKAPDVDDVTYSMSSFGVAGLVGAEFYPWKNLSLAAEYQIGFVNGSSSYDDGTDEVDGPKAKLLGISAVGVTLAFHFK
jgi:opacity protein-like surface antigen